MFLNKIEKNWSNVIIDELEALDEIKDVRILNSYGKMCCRTNKILDYVEKVRDTINILKKSKH